jgi:hypothetical protein
MYKVDWKGTEKTTPWLTSRDGISFKFPRKAGKISVRVSVPEM